ncbi:hydrogenase expression/formation protein [Sinimarinibacterium flocculans]|uniref:Hydrogenase-1 operon protein HyaF n=1 Tax=Sinimarinibacterium flocculans TaxID=985250 RepID=A0A318E8P0_9GAMM|nr:hydrogenase expression/formation protein [Sinimarinibacterium flocculans]PXV65660.1 hydrogenase-1 operon protein HyaF [Sinimarinibacterium flocculans]
MSLSDGSKPFPIPIKVIGPGSQPVEEEELQYMQMPRGMETYRPPILPERDEAAAFKAGQQALREIGAALARAVAALPGGLARVSERVDLTALDEADRRFVNQILGEGEVGARIDGQRSVRIQESVFASIWRVAVFEGECMVEDYVEVAMVPFELRTQARLDASDVLAVDAPDRLPPMVMNAPSILTELADQVATWQPGQPPHVINLTLLPLSPEDVVHLDERIGSGRATILSRGYGNCRVSSTRVPNCWRVVYYNSQDAVILNTLEIADMPEAVCAAAEDMSDALPRFQEVLEWVVTDA